MNVYMYVYLAYKRLKRQVSPLFTKLAHTSLVTWCCAALTYFLHELTCA